MIYIVLPLIHPCENLNHEIVKWVQDHCAGALVCGEMTRPNEIPCSQISWSFPLGVLNVQGPDARWHPLTSEVWKTWSDWSRWPGRHALWMWEVTGTGRIPCMKFLWKWRKKCFAEGEPLLSFSLVWRRDKVTCRCSGWGAAERNNVFVPLSPELGWMQKWRESLQETVQRTWQLHELGGCSFPQFWQIVAGMCLEVKSLVHRTTLESKAQLSGWLLGWDILQAARATFSVFKFQALGEMAGLDCKHWRWSYVFELFEPPSNLPRFEL